MPHVFYETNTKSLVSINDGTRLHIEQFPKTVPPGVPRIGKDSITLHEHDVYVLDSIKSGTSERTSGSGIYFEVLKPLLDNLFHVRYHYHATDSEDSVRALGKSLSTFKKPTLVIVISGDTSINEFVNSLHQVDHGLLRLFVIPAGTGNSLALSVGITDQIRAISRLFTHKQEDSKPLNLYEVNFPRGSYIIDKKGRHLNVSSPILFIVVASWAFHASLVADSDTEELRRYGLERFKMAAHQNLTRPQKYLGRVTVWRGEKKISEIEGPFAYFVLTPSRKFEPTFVILPEGNIFDSKMYLVSFDYQENDSYILDIMGQVYDNGHHIKNDLVHYECLDDKTSLQLHIDSENDAQNRRFCVDGAVVVVPRGKDQEDVIFRHHGHSSKGWDIEIIS